MRVREAGPELVHGAPDVGEPADDGVDGLLEELVAVGALADEGALGVARELGEDVGHFAPLALEIEGGHACVARLHARGGGED